jgi:hypothetical protein
MFFDRGVYRRITSEMDFEYDADELVYRFNPLSDADFYRHRVAARSYVGSINTTRFVAQTQVRAAVEPGSRSRIELAVRQQADLRARRLFVEVGYLHRVSSHDRIGASLTLEEYKPDLDFTLHYERTTGAGWKTRASLGLLDVANNFIFDHMAIVPQVDDTTRHYSSIPLLFELGTLVPVAANWRAEFYGGLQTKARAHMDSFADSTATFGWTDRAHYAGLLVEFTGLSGVAIGALSGNRGSRIERTSPDGSRYSSDYQTEQNQWVVAAYISASWRWLRGEFWAGWEDYSDTQSGTDFDQSTVSSSMNYRRFGPILQVRTRAVTDGGFFGGLMYTQQSLSFEDQDVMGTYLRWRHRGLSNRVTFSVGYLRGDRYSFELGGSLDIDGDTTQRNPARFDGGFGRAMISF